MKKLYTTLTMRDLSFSRSQHRSSLFKVASLGTAVALFLSNASPVFSANLDLTKASFESVKNAAVVYPQSTLSAYNDYTSGMNGYNSFINVLTANGRSAWKDTQNIFIAGFAVILDPEKYTAKRKSVAIDSTAHALGLGNIAIDAGYNNQDDNRDAFVNAYSLRVRANGNRAITVGDEAETRAYGKVILGEGSGTIAGAGAAGFDPFTKSGSTLENEIWKSNASPATIGNYRSKMSRQLEGVAAGTYSTDAVNVAQLKSLQKYVDQGWSLSVGGENAKAVGIKDIVDLSAASDNLKITKSAEDNNVKFDLADTITVVRVTAGRSSISDDGIVFADGAKITVDGIDAGNKKITGVANAEEDTDAVNFAQLQEIKNQITANSLVKQDGGEEGRITIGMATGGSEINIANQSGEDRIISGVKAAVNAHEAVNKEQLDGQIADVIDTIKSDNLVKREKETDHITIGKEIEGTEINIANKSGDARTISGVKAAVKNNEAVNKEQLDGEIADITDRINVIKEANSFSVLYDKNADGTINYSSVTLGRDKTKAPVALHNVKDGKIAEGSNDAINGGQINKISTDVAKFFGGGTVFQDGAFKGPRYNLSHVGTDGKVEQKIFEGVDSALTGLDANVKNVNSRLTHVTNEFTQKIDGVSKDSLLWNNNEQAFVALHGPNGQKTDSKITFLANGEISNDSTDAVNGSQLFETNQNVTTVTNNLSTISKNISKYFGGGADVSSGKAPSYTIQGKSHNDFGSAFSTVDNSITNIQNQITNATKNSLVKQEENEGTITIGKATGGTEINVANKSGDARTISGVKAAVNNDEAVNKEQLDGRIADISNSINNIKEGSAFAVLYDKNADGTVNYNSVSLGGGKSTGQVALLNVKDGTISQGSHDAINGGQINQISQDIANYFGGDASFENGTFKGPKYNLSTVSVDGEVKQREYNNVGNAFTGLNSNIKNVNSHLTNVVNNFTKKINDISQEVKGDALLWSGDEQAFVAQHGEGRTNSKIKFLLDGTIAEGSTDAITGNQLYLMSNQLAAYFGGGAGYNNGKWTAPTFKIAQFNNDGSSGEKKTYHDVANAFDGVSESMSKINNRIENVENNVSSNGLNWNKQKGAYDASHNSQPSKIINVADGKIVEGSKEAVNGGQLWKTNERVTGVEKDVKHLTNKVDNISTTVTDIGKTVFNIENRVDNIENTVNNLSDGAVNYDKDADGKKTNKITLKGGNESEPVMIDNVADGRIEQGSKEAVNGGQLHDYTDQQMKIVLDQSKHYTDQRVNNIVVDAIDDAVDRAHQYTDMKFNILSYDIKSVRKEARQAAAIGLAVSNLRYFDDPGSLSVSFGSGAWRGQSAFALGAGYTSENGKIRSNLSATSAGGHWGVGGAITLKIK